ncbi:unnamed protein product [Caretta caretta]
MAERVSPRGLVRSVSQRLKYYIDVQRKEDSFDLSGASRNEAESPSFYMHPGSIAEQKCDQCLKHNFTDCKFEASLRVYTGNSEECERKLQSSPERQQEMKIIKKKNWHKIKKLHSFPSRLSQFPPPPYTSQEEVMRLISSASKLIVAATCEISSEEIKKPDCALPQKRKEAKNIQRLDHYCKQHTPPLVISPDPHEYDTKSTGETNKLEESNADFIQEDSRNDYRKNTNKGKKEKNIRNVNGPVHQKMNSQRSSLYHLYLTACILDHYLMCMNRWHSPLYRKQEGSQHTQGEHNQHEDPGGGIQLQRQQPELNPLSAKQLCAHRNGG